MNTINERIKYLRELTELSQTKFAQELEVSSQFINDIEHNRTKITNATIKLICLVFEVNKEWLINGIGEIWKEQPYEDVTNLEPEYQEMKSLTQEEREVVLQLVRVFKRKGATKEAIDEVIKLQSVR